MSNDIYKKALQEIAKQTLYISRDEIIKLSEAALAAAERAQAVEYEPSMRDMFAAAALKGLLSNSITQSASEIARDSYTVADAMLIERLKDYP